MTFTEIIQLAGIFIVFTLIIHVYQSFMMKGSYTETLKVLGKNHEETVRVLEENHKETMRVLEENHKETMRVLDRIDERAEERHREVLEKV